MYRQLLLLFIFAIGSIHTLSAQNDTINPYILSIKEGKTLKDSRGAYLEVPVTLHNTSNDTLFYANWTCSWQELYKTDNPLLEVEVVNCDKNIMEVYALAPNDTTTVLLKLYPKYGQPIGNTKYRVSFELIKVPRLLYHVSPEERHSGNYLWSNPLVNTDVPPTLTKKSKINPWDGENGFRFAAGYRKDLEMEASYIITSFPSKNPGFNEFASLQQYLGAGLEYVKDGPRNAAGAKLSYEANYFLLAAQVGVDYLLTGGNQQARIMPKVGYSIFGVITVYYGWNCNLIKNSNLQPYKHVITLQFNLYDSLIDDLKLGHRYKKTKSTQL